MIIQIDSNHWINVQQIVDVELIVEKLAGVKLIISMSNSKIVIITKDCEGFIKELEEYRVPVRSTKK